MHRIHCLSWSSVAKVAKAGIHQYVDGSKTLWVNSRGNNMVQNIKIDGLDMTKFDYGLP